MKYIFDLDGTLYKYKGGTTFITSSFYTDIKRNVFLFLEKEVGIATDQVAQTYTQLKQQFSGHISLGVERQYGIARAQYFAQTWNLDPAAYITFSFEPRQVLEVLQGRFAIFSEAPSIWVERALAFLQLTDVTRDVVFTGDPDIRKPSKEAFIQVAHFLDLPFHQIISVGDQEESDISLPKSLGMRTVRVGSGSTKADAQIESIAELLYLQF